VPCESNHLGFGHEAFGIGELVGGLGEERVLRFADDDLQALAFFAFRHDSSHRCNCKHRSIHLNILTMRMSPLTMGLHIVCIYRTYRFVRGSS